MSGTQTDSKTAADSVAELLRRTGRGVARKTLARAGLQRMPRPASPAADAGIDFTSYTQAIPYLEDRNQPAEGGGVVPATAGAGLRRPIITVINDCADQGSFGTSALIDGLEQMLKHHAPGLSFLSVPSHWLIEAASLSEFPGGSALSQPLALWPDVADQFEEVADQWSAGVGGPGVDAYLDKLNGADLVLLNGEGSIFRNNVSAIRELFLIWFAKTRLGKPSVFANGSVHLTDVIPILPAMVRKSFGVLDAVIVREAVSARNLAAYAPQVDAIAMADSAYALSPELLAPDATVKSMLAELEGKPYFCYDPGHMTVDNRTPRRSSEYELIMALKELVPQAVLIPSPPVHPHAKRLTLIAEETGSINAGRLSGYPAYMALVEGAQFVVSGRHHDTILAAMVGTPTIAFGSTSHKVHGACESLGLVGTPFDSTDLRTSMTAIRAQAQRYLESRDDLGLALKHRSQELSLEALEVGRTILELANPGAEPGSPA